jgi:two-component system cell cycle sensor histidine kinase/response regulator CckA
MSAQVIIAEDEAPLRHILADMLMDRGLGVLQAEDGIDALQLIRDNPGVALLLSDVKMPRMDGFELVDAALKLRSELKILMMTAYAHEQMSRATLSARELRTLAKPFDPDRMCDLVCDMLSRP